MQTFLKYKIFSVTHPLHWTRAVTRFVFILFALFYTRTHVIRCSGAEILLSGFPRNEASMGAEFRGKKPLNKISAPEPSFYMCVLAMELRWRALPAGSAIINTTNGVWLCFCMYQPVGWG